MTIDFIARSQDMRETVMPCIWRVDSTGKDAVLIIVKPDTNEFLNEDGEYKSRPTSFETSKENKYTKETYVPCEYMEQHSEKREKEIRERLKAWEKKK